MSEADVFCPTCGLSKEDKAKICAVCGAALEAGSRFCAVCGAQKVEMNNFNPYGNPNQNPYQQPFQSQVPPNPNLNPNAKSKMAGGLLGIFLGSFGVHNFYLGYTGKAVAQLLITVLTCGFGAAISSIWGLIEGIMILSGSINTDAAGVPLKD